MDAFRDLPRLSALKRGDPTLHNPPGLCDLIVLGK